MKESCSGRQTWGESIRKAGNNIVISGESITNFSRYHKNTFNQKTEDRRAKFKYFPGVCIIKGHIALCESNTRTEYKVAIIHVSVNDLLTSEGDIDQINNILRIMERIVYKCRQYGAKNMILSG